MFENDDKVMREIKNDDDCINLQRDPDKFQSWFDTRLMINEK